jgi:streptogramin lyase
MIKAAGLLLSTLTLSTRAAYITHDYTQISGIGHHKDVAAGADGSFWYLEDSYQTS